MDEVTIVKERSTDLGVQSGCIERNVGLSLPLLGVKPHSFFFGMMIDHTAQPIVGELVPYL
jgi:hypothetical protein